MVRRDLRRCRSGAEIVGCRYLAGDLHAYRATASSSAPACGQVQVETLLGSPRRRRAASSQYVVPRGRWPFYQSDISRISPTQSNRRTQTYGPHYKHYE
jgi:hypothetical protein